LTVHTGTLESAEIADASLDAAFAWMVVEHLPDPLRTLRHIRRLLTPGGALYCSVPNFACWERFAFRGCWHALELPRQLQHFTPRTLRRAAQLAGYDSVEVIHQNSFLNVIGSVGIVLQRWSLTRRWGTACVRFTNDPTLPVQLAVAPLSKLLALVHQGGRLTCILRTATTTPAVSDPVRSAP
jgi:SAM-dependent methyltransferase